MFSETSPEKFVFGTRTTPSCDSKCVKMNFRVHREKRETVILTVTSRDDLGLSVTSGLSTFLHKTVFKLILICPEYSDTSLCPH